MTQLTVALPLDASAAGLHRAVLASVPSRFAVVAGADASSADVRVVSGASPDWVDQVAAAIGDGTRAVMLAGPCRVAADDVRELAAKAAAAGVVVAVDNPYVSDPAWTSALPRIREVLAVSSLVDSTVTISPSDGPGRALTSALIEQLGLVRTLLNDYGVRAAVPPSDSHYVVVDDPRRSGLAGDGADHKVLTLVGVVSAHGEPGLSLTVVGNERRCTVHFHDDALARPTEITFFDDKTQDAHRPHFESGYRACWARLHDSVTNGTPVVHGLDDLALAMSEVGAICQD